MALEKSNNNRSAVARRTPFSKRRRPKYKAEGDRPRLCNSSPRESFHIVTPSHPLNTALAVHNSLLSGVKGMAFAANLYPKAGLSGASLKGVATRASHGSVMELGVNICLHFSVD
jgi:hypothetical protein